MATGNYIVAYGSSCYPYSRMVLSQHGGPHAVISFGTASRDTQTLNLSRNASLMTEQQSQSLLLKVDSLSTILTEDGKNVFKVAICEIRVFVPRILPPLEHSATYFSFFVVQVE